MKKFNEYVANLVAVPEKEVQWYGYSKGQARLFKTRKEAQTFSSNVESVVTNINAIEDAKKHNNSVNQAAFVAWQADLFNEAHWLNKRQCALVYRKAIDNRYSEGNDAIADEFFELAEFVETVNNTKE